MAHCLPSISTTRTFGLMLLVIVVSKSGAAQNDQLGWSDTAELTLVFTGGNAEATTLGLRNALMGDWEQSSLSIELGALRAESTQTTRIATGTSPLNFQVATRSARTLTAEHYFARGRYDRRLKGGAFWYAGWGWERNTFAGFDHRYVGDSGVGYTWLDNHLWVFETASGVGYTVQHDVNPLPGADNGFAGVRFSYTLERRVTPNTEFSSTLVADENLELTTDFRADLTNAVTVSMTSRLALKASWQLLYDHLPSLESLPLRLPSGNPLGGMVLTPLASVDQIVTFALVASF